MDTIPHNFRYLPHQLTTRFYAVKLYRSGCRVDFVCRRYHISKASLMRWNSRFDGTKESLTGHSHRPRSPHPNAHTAAEMKWICDYHRRNPHISVCELYGRLRTDKGYARHPGSLYRVFVRLGFRKPVKSTKNAYRPKHYDTPKLPGIKWQMDVKFIPRICHTGHEQFYQYTVIDEATRERFIYPYDEQNATNTVDFVKRAIFYFGYKPYMIQTDNGSEFTHIKDTKRVHSLDILCSSLGITHKLIRPRTPWHNGKVERSHRNDQQRFYNFLRFYSFDDLKMQMAGYLKRSNNIPMAVLGWKSPLQKRADFSV